MRPSGLCSAMTDQIRCKYHASGACKFGSSCKFSHDASKPLSQVCTYYLAGYCAYGERCRYDHVRPERVEWSKAAREGSSGASSSSAYAAPPIPKPPTDPLETMPPISRLRLSSAAGPGASGSGAVPLPVRLPAGPGYAVGADGGIGGDGGSYPAMAAGEAAAAAAAAAVAAAEPDGAGACYEVGEEEYCGEGEEGYWDDEGEEGAAGAWNEGYEQGYVVQQEGDWYGDEYGQEYEEGGYYDIDGTWHPGVALQQEQQQQQQQQGGGYGPDNPAWQQPAAGGAWEHGEYGEYGEEEEEGWSAAAAAAAAAAVPLAQRSLCMQYLLNGSCAKGDACNLVHGEYCQHCHRYALHPHDEAAAAQHAAECRLRHERLEARARSSGVECCICLERVLEKADPRERKFGLMGCDHAFCLGCIRNWRQRIDGPADVDSALRTCPVCRTTTHFITPSTVWPATQEEKDLIVNGYKAKLSSIDCKHFAFGEGTCPFSSSCFYRHQYRDGRLEEPSLRKAAADEGDIRVLQPVRLSDFLSASSAGQQLLGGGRRRR